MLRENRITGKWMAVMGVVFACVLMAPGGSAGPGDRARRALQKSGVSGGFVVHVGGDEGKLTAALRADDAFVVQGLARDTSDVRRARRYLREKGVSGPVSVAHWTGKGLPYIDNLVDLLVVEDPESVARREIGRVLSPDGVACLKKGDGWQIRTERWPEEIDEWTHYLHDSSGNPVSEDQRVGPPEGLQWVGKPRWARHHDHMASVSAAVSADGRMFYIVDRGSPKSILLPSKWYLVARDAFNGTILWKKRIDTWRSPLIPRKSGPAQLPRRLVAVDETVYVTLGIDAPVSALDAATGKKLRTYPKTKGTREILVSDGRLFALAGSTPGRQDPDTGSDLMWMRNNKKEWWNSKPSRLTVLNTDTGKVLWQKKSRVLPLTMAVSGGKMCYHNGKRVVCLDAANGKQDWSSKPLERAPQIYSFFGPSLAIKDDTVIFAGGKHAGVQGGEWVEKDDTMSALSLKTGQVKWTAPHPPSGYRSPEDLFVLNDRVWVGGTTSGRVTGHFTGRTVGTGKQVNRFPPDVDTYWFHHRCYRGKATDKYLLTSRTGIEYVDPQTGHWNINHWVRGGCVYGIMPANGLTYAPPHPCACYILAKLKGFNALSPSPAVSLPKLKEAGAAPRRLEGPAFGEPVGELQGPADWPTYRHDRKRSGSTSASVPTELDTKWRTSLEGDLSAVVAAGDRVLVAAVDSGTVYAVHAGDGDVAWSFTAGGRVDSPPTVWEGRILFGSADGHVYCLRASDGRLIWRYRAAPANMHTMSYGQPESVWPVHGSVLVRNGTVYCVAGRSMFLDGGLRMLRLDAETGRKLGENVMDQTDPTTGKSLQAKVQELNMPTALPDVLSCYGDSIYMRAQEFNLEGERVSIETPTNPDEQEGEGAHLFSPTGFLDDSWFHRAYWVYGKTPLSGFSGYPKAARNAPAGRIMAFDGDSIYSYGREPKYMRWTTPMEYRLFASPRRDFRGSNKSGIVRVPNSESLNPANTPLTVSAWVKPKRQKGVVLARGGWVHGYSLYLKEGTPRFALRVNKETQSVACDRSIPTGVWTHLAGLVTADKKLKVYINGTLAATDTTKGLVAGNPTEPMQVGADQKSPVGHYSAGLTFNGSIDEVRVYREALAETAVEKLSRASDGAPTIDAEAALYYSFDGGKVRDLSGNKNHGEGGEPVPGKFGKGRSLRGMSYPDFYEVKHRWARRVPLHPRAMVLADDTLFMAGPPDLVDEDYAVRHMNSDDVQQRLRRQDAAWDGEFGAMLLAVDREGNKLAEYRLDSLPTWDGMSAAAGQLYLTLKDGSLVCMGGKR